MKNILIPDSPMKKVVAARLFQIGCLAAVLVLPVARCGAAAALIDYQRVLYLPLSPTYAEGTGLVQGRDGKLYGTLRNSVNYGGALFRVEPNGAGYTVIYSSSTNQPSGVIESSDGRLYGTIAGHPVTNTAGVFRMDRDGGNFTLLRTFSSDQPRSGVIQDGEGWLYGTTTGDGLQNGGSVFKLATNGTGFQELHRFGGWTQDDGFVPGALRLGRDGLLYGCTFFGGFPSNVGTVFRLRRDGSDYAVLHRFGDGLQGRHPEAHRPLLEGSDGFLYGAANGGVNRAGVIFKLNRGGGDFQVIHQFEGEDGTGDSPFGGLVEWCDGTLYGATYEGGIDGAGTVFRLNKDGSGFAVLHVYIDAPDPGATEGTPRTALLAAADGRLYGLTSGGTVAAGTVFRIDPLLTLHIRPGPDAVVLSWPACPEGYGLEESNEFGTSPGWSRVEVLGEVIDSVRQVTLPRTAERRFFRLIRP